MDKNKLIEAYESVEKFTDAAFNTGVVAEKSKETFELNTADAILSGKLTGKNDAERKAAAIQKFADTHANVEALRMVYKINAKQLDLAKLHLACLRDLLRIEELAKA